MKNWMSWLYKGVDNSSLTWLVPVVFSAVLVFAAITGFYKGWKSALFYAIFDIATFAGGVFAIEPLLKFILDKTHPSSQIDFGEFIHQHPAVVPLMLLIWMPIMRIFGFLIHLLIRKRFHFSMNVRKWDRKGRKEALEKNLVPGGAPGENTIQEVKSAKLPRNIGARSVGLAVSMVGAVPYAFVAANFSTIYGGAVNKFSPIVDKVIYGTTFTRYDGVSSYVKDIYNIGKALDNKGFDVLKKMFTGTADPNDASFAADLNASQKYLQGIIGSDSFIPLFKSLPAKTFDFYQMSDAINNNQLTPLPAASKFVISQQQFTAMKNHLISSNPPTTWAQFQASDWTAIQNAFFNIK